MLEHTGAPPIDLFRRKKAWSEKLYAGEKPSNIPEERESIANPGSANINIH
jgi:hypothetical protein